MLEEKDYNVIKEKACNEIKKIRQRMESQSELQKSDWEQLCLALKVYEKLLNVESMEKTGYSGYSRADGYAGDGYSGRRGGMSRDGYSGYSNRSYGGGGSYSSYSYDDEQRVLEDMLQKASPHEREVLDRMMRNIR
jgi:hypothetical protein